VVELSDAVLAKAKKYVAEGRVMQDANDDSIWWVEGSRQGAPYRVQVVVLADGTVRSRNCTCRHGKAALGVAQCSHVVAALARLKEVREG
jgi:uncharacterized Zn finger protein